MTKNIIALLGICLTLGLGARAAKDIPATPLKDGVKSTATSSDLKAGINRDYLLTGIDELKPLAITLKVSGEGTTWIQHVELNYVIAKNGEGVVITSTGSLAKDVEIKSMYYSQDASDLILVLAKGSEHQICKVSGVRQEILAIHKSLLQPEFLVVMDMKVNPAGGNIRTSATGGISPTLKSGT